MSPAKLLYGLKMIRSASKSRVPVQLAGKCGVLLALRPIMFAIFSRRRDLAQYSAVDASAMIFIAYAFLGFLFAVQEIAKGHKAFHIQLFFQTNLVFFLLYTLLCFASLLWTVNVLLTGYRAFECLSLLLLIAAVVVKLLLEQGREVLFEWILKWYVVNEIVCRVLQCIPDWGNMLEMSQMTATIFFFLALLQSSNLAVRIIVSIFSIFSSSTTSYIGMAGGLFAFLWGNKRYKIFGVMLAIGVIVAFCIWGIYPVLKNTVFVKRSEIGIAYTSGRDQVWQVSFEAANERPWTGYGFFSGEPYVLYRHFRGALNAHSSFCSALLGLGYPGLILISLFIFSYLLLFFRQKIPLDCRVALFGCYSVAVCHCIANPGIGSRVYGSWMSAMTLFVMISAIALELRLKNKGLLHSVQSTAAPKD